MNRCDPRHLRQRQAAFTLLELLVVLAVVSLTVTIIGPRLAAGMPSVSVRGAAAEIASGLQEARNRALTENRAVAVELRENPSVMVIEGQQRELRGVALRVAPESEPLPRTVRFYPDGSSDGLVVNVVAGDRRQQVTVDWLSGRVRVAAGEAGDG